jgi:hypothetical protein
MATSISSLLIECLGLFNALVARRDLVSHDAEVPVTLWADELGRLRVWAANIGAHQTGQSSLDYRLRDASHNHPFSQRQWVKGAKDVREVRLSGQDGREDVRKLYQFATHARRRLAGPGMSLEFFHAVERAGEL